ncbi:tyrosine-type recombinase/integrase [Saccharothrix saharensis]|uniref:tyrosine-type recombinase/integrase n=1 Tax=Saccharothrix saharensis TaxID=571190 RepID=UPI0036AC00B1
MSERLEHLAASFRRDLRAEGKAERTTVIYGQSIRFFGDWLVSQGREATLDELTRSAIREWLVDLGTRNSPGTVRTRFKGLRRFVSWLVSEEIVATDVMKGMEEPPEPRTPVAIITDDQLAAIVKACGKTFDGRRDEALVRLLLDCGLRVAELCALKVEDVDLETETAVVTGKGSKVRHVYFSAKTARALDRYQRVRGQHRLARQTDAFFLSQRGPLSTDGARYRVEVLAKAAGIKGGLNPHKFRHTFAHDFLVSGGQERDLKRLAGWTSDSMLERYGASAADMRAATAARRLGRGNRV